MVFNDTTNYLGIIQSCEHYTNRGKDKISGDSDLLNEFTRYSNKVMREVWHEIFLANGNWLYDDANQTNLPQATTDLTASTATYLLPSSALTIERIEVTDESGNDYELDQMPLHEIPVAVDEWRDGDGIPRYYRVFGETIELFPAPSYSATSGLKVYFQRAAVEFDAADTTEEPGFASPYHDIVPIGASIEWIKVKDPSDGTLAELRAEYQAYLTKIKDYYRNRNRHHKPKLKRQRQSFK